MKTAVLPQRFLVAFLLFLSLSCSRRTTVVVSGPSSTGADVSVETLDTALKAFARTTDADSSHGALQQINAYLVQGTAVKPAALTPKQEVFLADPKAFNLDKDELVEIGSSNFTLLDAHHLDLCFLLRDAAASLGLRGTVPESVAAFAFAPAAAGPGCMPWSGLFLSKDRPVQQAAIAFAWVVRQVRVRDAGEGPLPPQFVLRRGWGSAEDRAQAFLAMLDQIGMDGCLIAYEKEGKPALWACGALVGGDIYLFDPRLGLPLPGPGGQGIATLAGVRAHPELLGQLTVDEKKYPYDIKPDDTRHVKLLLVCPLSALAPRMKYLEDHLAAAGIRVRLAGEPAALLERLESAAERMGGPDRPAVQAWAPATRVLYDFMPREQGGVDPAHQVPLQALHGYTEPGATGMALMHRQELFEFQLAHWQALPEPLRRLPVNDELGQRPRKQYAALFIPFYTIPGSERDQVLRGRFNEASPRLVDRRSRLRDHKARLELEPTVATDVAAWTQVAVKAYAALYRAQRDVQAHPSPETQAAADEAQAQVRETWLRGEPALLVYLQAAAADPMAGESTYQLALCLQEQAERLQARLNRQPSPETAKQAAEAWRDAEGWWATYASDYAKEPGAAAARHLRACALTVLGDKAAAVALLEDLSGEMTDLEKTARLYEARQVKAK